jgi:hypothetical protein
MSRVIEIRISGAAPETDAPDADDALDELKDWLAILRGVEAAAAGSPASALIWRIVGAKRNSPLTFQIEAFPKDFATNVDHRVDIVVTETARGLATLQARAERPPHFTDEVMIRARRFAERVSNGLGLAEVDFGRDLPGFRMTGSSARAVTRNVDLVLNSPDAPYREVGSAEGYLQAVERDGFGRPVARLVERVTGQSVKCIVTGLALAELETREIRDIWRYRRIQVYGLIHFAGLGNIDHIDAQGFRFMRGRSELPQIDDIMDPEFTGGMRSEQYLERLRDGTLS